MAIDLQIRRVCGPDSGHSVGMTTFNEQEQDTIRRGFFGAVALVSKADPGFFASFKESFAASKAMADAPAEIRDLLRGGFIAPPKASSAAEMDQALMTDLNEAMAILQRDPASRDAFANELLDACQQVADASKGVSPEEQAVLDKVRAAVSTQQQPPADQPPANA